MDNKKEMNKLISLAVSFIFKYVQSYIISWNNVGQGFSGLPIIEKYKS